MPLKPERPIQKRGAALRRRIGAVACLLALAVVLFGHLEAPDAALPVPEQVPLTGIHVGAAQHGGSALAGHHCAHAGPCALYAVLPAAPPTPRHTVRWQRFSLDLRAESRTISPLRHPPKAGAPL